MPEVFIDGEYWPFTETPFGALMIRAMTMGLTATVHGMLLDLAENALVADDDTCEQAAEVLRAAIQFCHEINPENEELRADDAAVRFKELQQLVKERNEAGGYHQALRRVWSITKPLATFIDDLDAESWDE